MGKIKKFKEGAFILYKKRFKNVTGIFSLTIVYVVIRVLA